MSTDRLDSNTQRDLRTAVDVIEANNPGTGYLGYQDAVRWMPVHGCKTSEMAGFKLGSRQDSTGARLLWVGLCPCSGKTMHPSPLVYACFTQVPTTRDLVTALREAITNAA